MPVYVVSYDLDSKSPHYSKVIDIIESGKWMKLLQNVWGKVADDPHQITGAIRKASKGTADVIVTEFNPSASCHSLSKEKVAWLKEQWQVSAKWDFLFGDDEDEE